MNVKSQALKMIVGCLKFISCHWCFVCFSFCFCWCLAGDSITICTHGFCINFVHSKTDSTTHFHALSAHCYSYAISTDNIPAITTVTKLHCILSQRVTSVKYLMSFSSYLVLQRVITTWGNSLWLLQTAYCCISN